MLLHHSGWMKFVCLTSPWMSGVAPMAFCRALTSTEGPVIRDVPVSTMASQPLLHRLSWLPTAILLHTQSNTCQYSKYHHSITVAWKLCTKASMQFFYYLLNEWLFFNQPKILKWQTSFPEHMVKSPKCLFCPTNSQKTLNIVKLQFEKMATANVWRKQIIDNNSHCLEVNWLGQQIVT